MRGQEETVDTATPTVTLLDNHWDDAKAATLDEPGLLLYRSNLLGADKRITNYGGGNTSAKVMETDPLTGETAEVLWVKGSGGDVGTIKLDGFATLYMDKLRSLKTLYKGVEDEDRMVGFLPHATFNLNARAASIDTPLHGFLPYKHVDHMHPDAIIAIAASKNSRELTQGNLRRRDRLAAVAPPGIPARSRPRGLREGQSRCQGRRARKPRPVHLGG